jgi:hypothetical protein
MQPFIFIENFFKLTLVAWKQLFNFTPIMKQTVVHTISTPVAISATGTTTFTTTIR